MFRVVSLGTLGVEDFNKNMVNLAQGDRCNFWDFCILGKDLQILIDFTLKFCKDLHW